MFTLKIHTVDFQTAISTSDKNDLKPVELMGVAHLFRQLVPTTTIFAVNARTPLLFVVAVPNYMSTDDFLRFCGNQLPHFQEIMFLRNAGMEDRYSVLIRLEDQVSADGFYCNYNGKRFKPSEVEVCHIYFSQSVDYYDNAEMASMPPPGYTELPSCPVCLERLDPDTSGIQSTLCDHSFRCSCVLKWTYMSCPVCRLCQQQEEKPVCSVCGTLKNLWICLICGFVGCGRYEKGHASGHWSDKKHHFSLELEKQQIWDYVGDRYVHRLNQSKVDRKSVGSKSNGVNLRCSSTKECGTCGNDEEGLGGALFNSKVDAVLDEYNHLLASQLEIQRQQYETLLAEKKSMKESLVKNAVEKAIFSMTHEIQSKLENNIEEKKALSDKNQELTEKQALLQAQLKEIQEREKSTLKSKDEKIADLQEQIRDLKIYVEAQKKFAGMTDSDDIRGGTVLPLEPNQPSSANSNTRSNKSGRRRRN